MAHRVYVNCPLAIGSVTVIGPEAHHLAAVCRVRPGDAVCLFNGDGRQYPALVREVTKRSVIAEITTIEAPQRELGHRLEVAAPLPKGDRGQFLVEKLTELGVTTYVPLMTQRSVITPGATRLDKLERYVLEASKQTGRNALMRVQPPTLWTSYCSSVSLPTRRLLAVPGVPSESAPVEGDVAVAVGPEGGWTPEEIDLGHKASWRFINLGPRILRIETAAVVLATLAGAAVTNARADR